MYRKWSKNSVKKKIAAGQSCPLPEKKNPPNRISTITVAVNQVQRLIFSGFAISE